MLNRIQEVVDCYREGDLKEASKRFFGLNSVEVVNLIEIVREDFTDKECLEMIRIIYRIRAEI